MKDKQNNIAVIIPARGGSKGIPNKNIYPLGGKPLIYYTIEAAKAAGYAGRIYVSTDSERIAEISKVFGAKIIRRPDEIANDTASTEAALLHSLEVMREKEGFFPDYILTLPPTSPFRTAGTIMAFVDHFFSLNGQVQSMHTLTETRNDYWIKDKENGRFHRLFPDAPRRRQEREPLYIENSAIYITTSKILEETGFILGGISTGFVIDQEEATDINEPIDIEWCEFLLGRRKV